MRELSLAAAMGLALMLVGCGGASDTASKAPEPAAAASTTPAGGDAASSGASNAQQGAEQMAKGMEQLAKGLQQMSANAGKAAPFEDLVAVLAEVNGWTRTEPKGEQVNMPVSMSRAEAEYSQGDTRVDVEITDTALSQMLLAPLSMFMVRGFEERSSDGYKRYAEFQGQPGFEEWTKGSSRGELTVIVNKRFIVQATGRGVANLDPVKQVMGGLDLAKLASLK